MLQEPMKSFTTRATIAEDIEARISVGDVLMDGFTVVAELGRGGMGRVYKCFYPLGKIHLAMKVLPPSLAHNTAAIKRLDDSFKLAGALNHPHIANVKFLLHDPKSGMRYLFMECVEGETLRERMLRQQREGGIRLEEGLSILRQVAEALDYAHQMSILHCDIKPSNIMIQPDGTAKILDFGLATQIQREQSAIDASQSPVGTGSYMAPEQWRGQPLTAASDQYALAVLAYELFAGCLPFECHDLVALRQIVLTQQARQIPILSRVANKALLRALSKEPVERFASCQDFVNAIYGQSSSNPKKVGFRVPPVLKRIITIGGLVVAALWITFKLTAEQVALTSNNRLLLSVPKRFTSYTVPDGVVVVGEESFAYCTRLKEVTLPEGVRQIDDRAFYGCSSLERIALPKSLRSIGESAFHYCRELQTIELPEGVTSIPDGAFKFCYSLSSVKIPDSVRWIGENVFDRCEQLYRDEQGVQYESAERKVLVQTPETLSGEFVVPSTVRFILDEAFIESTELTSIVLTNKQCHFSYYSFKLDSERTYLLQSIWLPKGTSVSSYPAKIREKVKFLEE